MNLLVINSSLTILQGRSQQGTSSVHVSQAVARKLIYALHTFLTSQMLGSSRLSAQCDRPLLPLRRPSTLSRRGTSAFDIDLASWVPPSRTKGILCSEGRKFGLRKASSKAATTSDFCVLSILRCTRLSGSFHMSSTVKETSVEKLLRFGSNVRTSLSSLQCLDI